MVGTPKQKAARWHNWLIRLVTYRMNDGTIEKIINNPTSTWESVQLAKDISKLYRELLVSLRQRKRLEP